MREGRDEKGRLKEGIYLSDPHRKQREREEGGGRVNHAPSTAASFIHSLIHSLTHSLTHSLSHSLTLLTHQSDRLET
jgi:hypothetical protein